MVRAESPDQETAYRCQCGNMLVKSSGRGVRLTAVFCRGCKRRRTFYLLRTGEKPVAEVIVGGPDQPKKVDSYNP